MNPWYWLFSMLLIFGVLILVLLISGIVFVVRIKKKENTKSVKTIIISAVALLLIAILYSCSHRTYYRYNDWAIIGKDIRYIEQKYGEFDLGIIKENQKGRAAYFIYTDKGPVMPDYLDHYYYMDYDEKGTIYEVHDGVQPGG